MTMSSLTDEIDRAFADFHRELNKPRISPKRQRALNDRIAAIARRVGVSVDHVRSLIQPK
jgi:hypothetical protein